MKPESVWNPWFFQTFSSVNRFFHVESMRNLHQNVVFQRKVISECLYSASTRKFLLSTDKNSTVVSRDIFGFSLQHVSRAKIQVLSSRYPFCPLSIFSLS